MSGSRPLAVGVDLGSTAIKAGVLDARGRLTAVQSVAAPALRGEGRVREGDAEAYAAAACGLLESVARQAPGAPLGLATQRSTFTLWDRRDGRPWFPMVSWQDTRAADWCERHRRIEWEVVRRTGLPLSAHYIGPKLATLRESDDAFSAVLGSGRFALGTLETFLIWRWSDGRRHETDVTVAARSLLLDIERNAWSTALLERFGVPASVLPDVVPTTGRHLELEAGLDLTATISDQAAAALAVFDPDRSSALVNLGTGAFVLCPTDRPERRLRGYLLAPVLAGADGERRWAVEGTVNGAGPAVDTCGPGPTELPGSDPCPGGFAVPDLAGLGSPYWRPEIGLTLSLEAMDLPLADRRRIVLEGVLFRVRQILEDLLEGSSPERILVGGGLSRNPAVGRGLATLLDRPVERILERESGLLGVTRLAAGLTPYADPPTETIEPGPPGSYLPGKFPAWKGWLESLLTRSG